MIVFLFKVEKVLVGLSGSGRVRFSTNLLRKHVTQIHPSFITRGSSSSKSRDAAVADHHGGIRRPAPRHRAPRGDRQEERQEIGARAEPRRQDGQAAAKRGCTHAMHALSQCSHHRSCTLPLHKRAPLTATSALRVRQVATRCRISCRRLRPTTTTRSCPTPPRTRSRRRSSTIATRERTRRAPRSSS